LTLKERILQLLATKPGLTDREITNELRGQEALQQPINQAAAALQKAGRLRRRKRADGRIANFLVGDANAAAPTPSDAPEQAKASFMSEDDVKRAVQAWLEAGGWHVKVAWAHERGIDINAHRPGCHWIIEAKGEGSLQPMRVNYFLCVLGEILQRMGDPSAQYSVAFPDLPQYRGLWQRMPTLAKERARISALFVSKTGRIERVD
jgi:hypothetical protein